MEKVEEKSAGQNSASVALKAICFGFFLVVLDTTALNVALGSIRYDLGGTITSLQWVVNSYTVVFASLMLTCGAIGDRFGSLRFYQLGLVLFTGMSFLCALSNGMVFLILARSVQGLGAAMMLPASLSLLRNAFPDPGARTKAVAYWASIVSLGFAAGPILGGALTSAFGWRAIFWMNVPVGLIALYMVGSFVQEAATRNLRHIDWLGQALASLALFCLTDGLIEAGHLGWTSPRVLGALGAAIVLTILFLVAEKRSSSAVLPPSLFANTKFSVCVACGLVLNFAVYGALFVESVYLQDSRHLSALATGLMILPLTVLPTVTTRLIVKYSSYQDVRRSLAIGQFVSAAGCVVLGFIFFDSGYWVILAGLGLLGIGLGFVMPAITAGVLASSPPETAGVASGILNSGRQVGGTLGVALMGSLFYSHHLPGLLVCFSLAFVLFLFMGALILRALQ